MTRLVCEISMSLDGFIAGPNDRPGNGLGDGGERLHQWIVGLASWREQHGMEGGESGADSDVIEESVANIGAVLMGRSMFDCGEEPWGDEPPFHSPVFIVTHNAREEIVKEGGTTYTFVTDGLEAALEQARRAAGGKDVSLAGGANMVQQVLKLGVLDELQIHLVPVLLCSGRPLFDNLGTAQIELDKTRVIDSAGVTHLRLRPAR
jgi:dihydrofolate reductase